MKSEFFDDKENITVDHDDTQINMFESSDEKKILKKLHKEIQMLIEKKISVYLSDKAEEAVEAMITERKTFPEFPNDVYGQMRKNDLKRVIKEIFILEPLIFHKLKQIQEKSLLVFEFAFKFCYMNYVKSQYKAFEDKGKVGLVFQVDN